MIPEKLQKIIEKYDQESRSMVVSAYTAAEESLKDKKRDNGKPFIDHPLGVAEIVSSMIGLTPDAVAAIFLHEANRFQGTTAEEINSSPMLERFRKDYPKDIIDIVIGLNKISFIRLQETNLDEERYRKLIISYSTDPKVVLIKLADRLELMRNVGSLTPAKRKVKMMESMLLYIPLTHQLGLYNIKTEMEDLFLRYTEPEKYKEISRKLKETAPAREALVEEFIKPLEIKLKQDGIKYELKARTKSPYSIWKKMLAQKLPFEDICDIFAIRFIIEAPDDREREAELCWRVYSLVTEEYEPDTNRLRDWISKPRPNGYESLHTTVKNTRGDVVEVQIRTERMDFNAEQGNAAHWSYKGIKSQGGLTDWLNSVRNLMKEGKNRDYEHVPAVLNEILVYTPAGDLRQLHKGATLLDFAFEIHTNIGLRCTGGRINGKMASIKEELNTGDVVEIITSKNQRPSEGWLNFTVTSKARAKIRQKLKEEENKRATIGKELLARRLKNWKLTLGDEALNELVKKLKFKTVNEFFGAIGDGRLDPMEVKEFLTEARTSAHIEDERIRPVINPDRLAESLVLPKKLQGITVKISRCCHPSKGDPVFGFITIKEGVKIHRDDCPNASRLKTNYPYRVIAVNWKGYSNGE